jgi:type VI secretion system secreted protein VgrG
MKGNETLGSPFWFELEVLGLDEKTKPSQMLGQSATVTIEVADGGSREFNGLITQFSREGMVGRFFLYRMMLRPWLWMLSLTRNTRIFKGEGDTPPPQGGVTVPEVVKQIFKDHGFADVHESLTGTYKRWECLVQYRETDLSFVSRLLEQEGIYFYFKHQDGKHILELSDSYSAHATVPKYTEVPFFPPTAHEGQRRQEHFDVWNIGWNVQSGAVALNDFDFTKPKTSLLTKASAPNEHPLAEFEIYDAPGAYVEAGDGEASAKTSLEGLNAGYEIADGSGPVRGLGCGHLFRLVGHPWPDNNREYLITSANYHMSNTGFESEGETPSEEKVSCTIKAIESGKPFRSTGGPTKPFVQGPQTATVVGPAGEEIWCDKYGRVKIQFHWDRQGKKDENASCWVRVGQVWAGNGFGAMHIPRIGQEVIVEFLEGDPDRPIITGRVYNADNMPPYELPANKTQSGLKSRSSKKGNPDNFNEIRFEDKKGEEELFIHAELDLRTVVKHDETVTIGNNRVEKVVVNEDITIGENRTENVGKNEDITIGENREEKVGGNEKVTVTGKREVSVGKGDTLNITGMRVVTVSEDQTHTISGKDTFNVSKDQKVAIDGNRVQNIGKMETLDAVGNVLITSKEQIVLQSGDASITLKKDGEIVIKGKNITIDGSKVNVKASGDVIIKGSKVAQN